MYPLVKKINEYTLRDMYISVQFQRYPIGNNSYDNPYAVSFRGVYNGEDTYLCQLTGYHNYKTNYAKLTVFVEYNPQKSI